MKTTILIISSALCLVGCSTTPKVTRAQPMSTGSYGYGTTPKQRELELKGSLYKEHLRGLGRMAAQHEARLVAMEYESKEKEVAEKLGVSPVSPTTPSATPGSLYLQSYEPLEPPVQLASAPIVTSGYSSCYPPPSFLSFQAQVVSVPPIYYPRPRRERVVIYHYRQSNYNLLFGGSRRKCR